MNPAMKEYWTATPTVYSGALVASLRSPANHRKPVSTIVGPSRLSGLARHVARPLPISDTPTHSVREGPGSVGRLASAVAARHGAAAPAASAARTSRNSFALMVWWIVASIARRGRSWVRVGLETGCVGDPIVEGVPFDARPREPGKPIREVPVALAEQPHRRRQQYAAHDGRIE